MNRARTVKRLDKPFIVVSGLPGSGKTTVARTLASLLDLPVFDKDEILEQLFDTKGVGDSVPSSPLFGTWQECRRIPGGPPIGSPNCPEPS